MEFLIVAPLLLLMWLTLDQQMRKIDSGTINAVREYRRLTGAALLDSKRAVDRLRAEQ